LRHSSNRIFGTWEDDYDVMSGDRIVGRIFKSTNAPRDRPWMWVITGELVVLAVASNGFAPGIPRRPQRDGLCGRKESSHRISLG
jgi:hypothetical protein